MTNTVDVNFKTHIVFKKMDKKNAETEDETITSALNFSKKGLGQGYHKTYLPVLSTSADEGKEFKANVSEIFTSELFTTGIFTS